MMRDGLYELRYGHGQSPDSPFDSLLAVLRAGRVLGSDCWGGVLLGHYACHGTTSGQLALTLHVPAGGMLVTDDAPREGGAVIAIELDLVHVEDMAQIGTGVVEIAGQPVRIELAYVGPVPD